MRGKFAASKQNDCLSEHNMLLARLAEPRLAVQSLLVNVIVLTHLNGTGCIYVTVERDGVIDAARTWPQYQL